uniref:Uncharacterized protein n=1 Tax=Tetraselmis sp. GSL018 TaxID=582737 RepID=A0A061SAD6_9CHLO
MGRPCPAATEEGRLFRSQDSLIVRYGNYRRHLLEVAKEGIQKPAEAAPEEFALLTSSRDFSHLLTASDVLQLGHNTY